MTEKTVTTNWIKIYISGPRVVAEQICRRYCTEVGLCVTVEDTKFIYRGGEEQGVVVGLINYPRFPSTEDELHWKAFELAEMLRKELHQDSYLVMNPTQTTWHTVRPQ